MSSPEIVVAGSLNMDLVTRAPRLPVPGETISGRSFATLPGGKGANQAVAAARLGARTAMIGCVGDDAFGAQLRSPGKPPFLDVLDALLAEVEVERATLAAEIRTASPVDFQRRLEDRLLALPKVLARGLELVPHEELKHMTRGARAIVRSGEFTPCANVILHSGVVF